MKNYDMTQPANNCKSDSDTVAKHKEARDKVIGKKVKPMEKEEDFDDLDDLDDSDEDIEANIEESDTDDDSLKDSTGAEVKIINPIWVSNEKRQKNTKKKKNNEPLDTTPIWQKPPSRMSTKAWLFTLLILMIPGINIVMLLIWAFFSDDVAEEKRNFCRAQIIISAVVLIIVMTFGITIGGYGLSMKDIKNQASSTTQNFKNYTDGALHDVADNAQSDYDNLTDDNFSQ